MSYDYEKLAFELESFMVEDWREAPEHIRLRAIAIMEEGNCGIAHQPNGVGWAIIGTEGQGPFIIYLERDPVEGEALDGLALRLADQERAIMDRAERDLATLRPPGWALLKIVPVIQSEPARILRQAEKEMEAIRGQKVHLMAICLEGNRVVSK